MFMLSRTCTIAATLLALSVGAPGSLGQTASPTQFTLRALERQPGTIFISPGYITIIEFPDTVTRADSGNPTLLKPSPRKGSNLVVLTAAKLSGQTDLVITTGGKIVLFVVKIDPQGKGPRRYTVTGPSSAAAATATAATDLPRPAEFPAPVNPVPAPVRPAGTGSGSAGTAPGARYEAEAAIIYRADLLTTSQASGGRIVEHINDALSRVTFPAVRAPRAGRYTLRVYYTNGNPANASQTLTINGLAVPEVQYAPTGNWDKVASVDVAVSLRAGLNIMRFGRGQGVATLDAVDLLGVAGSASAPTAQAMSAQLPVAPLPVAQSPVGQTAFQAPAATRSALRQAVTVPNSGFENELIGWSAWQDSAGAAAQSIGDKQAHGGNKYLVLSSKLPRKQNVLQTVSGLSSGTYTLEMWVRSSAGLNGLTLFALDYGGKELNLGVPTGENTTWVKYTLPGIAVTNGQIKFGIWSNAPAGLLWAHIDDVALYREADLP